MSSGAGAAANIIIGSLSDTTGVSAADTVSVSTVSVAVMMSLATASLGDTAPVSAEAVKPTANSEITSDATRNIAKNFLDVFVLITFPFINIDSFHKIMRFPFFSLSRAM